MIVPRNEPRPGPTQRPHHRVPSRHLGEARQMIYSVPNNAVDSNRLALARLRKPAPRNRVRLPIERPKARRSGRTQVNRRESAHRREPFPILHHRRPPTALRPTNYRHAREGPRRLANAQ